MHPIKIEGYQRYLQIAKEYGGKGCMTNDYLQREASDLIAHEFLYECCGEKNAFLLVKKDGFWRMYYYLNDFEEELILDGETLVAEILFRGNVGEPVEQVSYLERCGFNRFLVRDQYYAKYSSLIPPVPLRGISIEMARSMEDIVWAIDLFNTVFDKWTGDFLPLEMAQSLADNKAILIAKDTDGRRLGSLHIEKQAGVTWIRHIAVEEGAKGQGVGRGLLDACIEQGHLDENSRYQLWVQRQNIPAVSMYQKKGFTYLNKSSLSLIKQ